MAVYELNGDVLNVTTKTQAALLERLGYERQDTPKKASEKEPEKESENPALTGEDVGEEDDETEDEAEGAKPASTTRKAPARRK